MAFCSYPQMGSLNYACKLFERIPQPTICICNTMIKALLLKLELVRTIETCKMILQIGMCPGNYTLPYVLKACTYMRNCRLGEQFHRHMSKLDNTYLIPSDACNEGNNKRLSSYNLSYIHFFSNIGAVVREPTCCDTRVPFSIVDIEKSRAFMSLTGDVGKENVLSESGLFFHIKEFLLSISHSPTPYSSHLSQIAHQKLANMMKFEQNDMNLTTFHTDHRKDKEINYVGVCSLVMLEDSSKKGAGSGGSEVKKFKLELKNSTNTTSTLPSHPNPHTLRAS
ncbi:hypothetical protein Sjap_014044 [Stephania japonica]|uniref:Uncharacterized protein n=1 Tax=Stephania japonica TaxID=461633 RepID=A0AAP0J133_9MAGN